MSKGRLYAALLAASLGAGVFDERPFEEWLKDRKRVRVRTPSTFERLDKSAPPSQAAVRAAVDLRPVTKRARRRNKSRKG